MKFLFFTAAILIQINACSQYRSESSVRYIFSQPIFATPQKTIIPGLLSDPAKDYRLISPIMVSSASMDGRALNNFFWTGTVTSLSFNKGKFGTYYYWDVQGNLRGMRGFIDISGKNKRGLKLVFPWR